MNDDQLWAAIDDQRRRTADLLDSLGEEQWDHPSLCAGWTVRHVAAHLTLQQQRVRDLAAFTLRNPRLVRSVTLNRIIHDSAVVQSRLPREELTGRIRATIGSRRHNSFVTPRETLTDILVHGQDIAVPLGLHLEVLPDAAAEAAARAWGTRSTWLASVFDKFPLDGYRLSATDVEWTVGDGPEVAGPIRALLLLLTGRGVALREVAGPGADELRRQRQAA
jgi:uncharacterized protein (TIGR03083 family)